MITPNTGRNIVGILSSYGFDNYGNCLQRYAVHRILEDLGFDVETIDLRPMSKGIIREELLRVACKMNLTLGGIARSKRFLEFDKNCKRVVFRDRRNLSRFAKKYFAVGVGSDQVWNPTMYEFAEGISTLDFVDATKRFTVSPSFGISTMTDAQKDAFRVPLSQYHRLSVREEAGRELIKEICGRDALVLVDPTMALSIDEWRKAAILDRRPSGRYVLVYALGDPSSCLARAKEIANSNNAELVVLNDPSNTYWSAGPGDFIGLAFSALAVVTDSFHASVFSILGHTDFEVVKRVDRNASMYSRIDTLTSKFGVDASCYNSEKDWKAIDEILEHERTEFVNYLVEELEWIARQGN